MPIVQKITCLCDGINPCQESFEIIKQEDRYVNNSYEVNEKIESHLENNSDHQLEVKLIFQKGEK